MSLESGKAVHAALQRLGHRAVLHDVGPDNLDALDLPADFVFIALHGEFGEDGTVQSLLDQRRRPYCGTGAEASRTAMDKVASKRLFEGAGIPTPAYEVVTPDNVVGSTFGQIRELPVAGWAQAVRGTRRARRRGVQRNHGKGRGHRRVSPGITRIGLDLELNQVGA